MQQRRVFTPSVVRSLAPILGNAGLGAINRSRVLGVIRRAAASRRRVLLDRGVAVPEMCFFSVTWRCNLDCVGCYAKGLPTEGNLTSDEIGDILRETTDAGTVLYAIAGGEPLQVPDLLEVLAAVPNGLFLLFTNGTLLDERAARAMRCAGNILPVLSVEGEEGDTDARRGDGTGAAVCEAMRNLRATGMTFAYSTMLTHDNLDEVTGRPYQDAMWNAGARLGFLVDYIPVPGSFERPLVLTAGDRTRKRQRIAERAAEARPYVVNFPEAEYRSGGCMSAGNGFVHISANGDLEPCTFSHYASHNLRATSYLDALSSQFFASLRAHFAERENPTGTCMLLLHDNEVSEIASRHGARCTAAVNQEA